MDRKQIVEKFQKILNDFKQETDKICEDYKNRLIELENEYKD